MKFALVLATVIALGTALPAPQTYNLKDDFNDFMALLPQEDILAIGLDYLANDAEVQSAVEFILSEDFKNFILEVEDIEEYKKFIKYLNEAGLDIYEALKRLHEILGLPEFVPPTRSHHRRGKGIRGLVDDIEAILPKDKIKALYYEKLESSPDFKQLIDTMSSDEFKQLVNDVRANPQYQELLKRAKEHGLDIEYIAELVNKIFGWGIETKFFSAQTFNLKDDLQDFINLLPVDDMLAIALDYLANDEEVQSAVEFIMSEDFKNFILEVESIDEYKKFIKYLNDSGLDVYAHIQKLHDILGLPEFVPPTRSHLRRGKGIRGLVDDIEAILPKDAIKALYYEKLESSPEFKQLFETMSSEEFKQLVNDVRANPQYQELLKRAKEHGLDIEYIAELVNKIFGWGIETKVFSAQTFNLKDDLHDFINLLPVDDMLAIALDYLANDEEVQSAVEFIMSEDFKNFILEVESIDEYKKFIKYLNDAGLDVYAHIQKLHDILGLPEFVPPTRSHLRRGKGIRGLVDDIEAILPKDAIKALYYEKLESSPEFKQLFETMSSEEFKQLVADVRANPQYKELIKRAKEHGLDIEYIAELVNKIFGWGIETKCFSTQAFNLKDDLYDFINLLPVDDMLAIALDYLANDEEVQSAVEFIMSEDFKDFILEVESIDEYKKFIKYLNDAGLDVYEALKRLHELLGLPEFVPPTRIHLRRGKGIRGLVDDIEAILPKDAIKALYYEKLESSPDFKQLIDTMSSEEFKQLVGDVRANPQYKELVKRAKEHGLDIEYIAQLVNKIFGWGIETLRK